MGLLPKKGLAALLPARDNDDDVKDTIINPELRRQNLFAIVKAVRAKQQAEEVSPVIDPTAVVSSNGTGKEDS